MNEKGFTLVELLIGVVAIPLAVFLIIFLPFTAIWGLNTLFGLAIPYTLKTWAAAFVLGVFIRGFGSKSISTLVSSKNHD